jgi:hypothetical protein
VLQCWKILVLDPDSECWLWAGTSRSLARLGAEKFALSRDFCQRLSTRPKAIAIIPTDDKDELLPAEPQAMPAGYRPPSWAIIRSAEEK